MVHREFRLPAIREEIEGLVAKSRESQLWPSFTNPDNWTLRLIWLDLIFKDAAMVEQDLMRWANGFFSPDYVFKDTRFHIVRHLNTNQYVTYFIYHFRGNEEFPDSEFLPLLNL